MSRRVFSRLVDILTPAIICVAPALARLLNVVFEKTLTSICPARIMLNDKIERSLTAAEQLDFDETL